MKARGLPLAVVLASSLFVLQGCPGKLDDPGRFSLSFTQCEANVNTLFAKTCAVSGCHSAADRTQNLDLESPNVASRLVGVSSTGIGCTGVLVDPKNPAQSFFYQKLTASPPCGSQMPFLGRPLGATELQCMQIWLSGLATADGGVTDAGITVGPAQDAVAPIVDSGVVFTEGSPLP
jgi:hypothetical protein